jgi:hypothetical protein
VRCDRAADTLGLLVEHDGRAPASRSGDGMDPAALAHIERCLRCQAQLAQHRKLRRNMARLRTERVVTSPDLVDQVLAAVAAAGTPDARGAWARHRAAYVAAATAATAAGAVLLASRSRRTRLAPAG